ncbi:hypothetical protein HPB51_011649 [Rhipicephalus microplus]|uniref:Uncharacterized protein n=1 Tax=Rhipicephalus microplus TaxID=6941 RepID=A0A9J6ETH1_RHIMP|nr:hypothetical protein HPB51_011649 [Rhipicephalus microplus]
MAGVPPRPEQTTLQIVVQGVQKEVKALHNPDGSFMTDANGYVYEASDGKRVTLRFMAGNRENDPPPAQPPTPSPACDGDVDSDGALAAFPAAAASAEDVEELWSARKTRFFIAKYSEMKDLVGKPGHFAPASLKHLKMQQSQSSATQHPKFGAAQRQKGSARVGPKSRRSWRH